MRIVISFDVTSLSLFAMQWIRLFEDGELCTGSYNLCVSTDKSPPGYSQLKTDVRPSSPHV